MATMTAFDDTTVTFEDCESVLLSAIPFLPGGMVDLALSGFGASLVDVCLVEAQSPLAPHEPVDSASVS